MGVPRVPDRVIICGRRHGDYPNFLEIFRKQSSRSSVNVIGLSEASTWARSDMLGSQNSSRRIAKEYFKLLVKMPSMTTKIKLRLPEMPWVIESGTTLLELKYTRKIVLTPAA